jgi:hypothetical protein
MSKFLAWLLVAMFMTTATEAKNTKTVPQCSVTGATEDNLMSDNMAEYIVKYGKGKVFTEFDME